MDPNLQRRSHPDALPHAEWPNLSPLSFEPSGLRLPIFVPPCVVLEGNSGVGKTTTSHGLAKAIDAGFPFPEYTFYVDSKRSEEIPPYPPTSQSAALTNNDLWIKLDRRRQDERVHRVAETGPFQVVDTSPISVFGFDLMKARLGAPHAISELAVQYHQLIEQGGYHEPEHWIFLRANPDLIHDRLVLRGGTHELLYRKDTMRFMDTFRQYFAETFLPQGSYVIIENDQLNPIEVVGKAKEFLVKNPTTNCDAQLRFCKLLANDSSFLKELLSL